MAIEEAAIENEVRRVFLDRAEALRGHRILMFGSRVSGTAGPLSDFDIGVDGAEPLDLGLFYEIEEALEQLPTLHRLDWVDLNRASRKVAESARREGRVLYEA
ncbi:nucleotidyltransferase domain-containing protein [Coraliomargarita sinensis]|uniref:Nucleotidyltransferase domain-containing protein n=1 Tax=Coraliomargarita sinensis TaxID=2174842 RepID=A0A317ZHF1_9BACT|nr:nucleotidyltransferase domain-containing protein [Coraliomargarita sinensis]PXA03663.1 nucleotidyltransferase domain-containing protein [Coraliomargarita sinensis]